ncbi:MAG: hypothetical protein V4722_10450 [Bacteroidota bacterium]
MKSCILFIAIFFAGMVCAPLAAQPQKKILILQELKCDGYDCYFKFFDPKTKKVTAVAHANFDDNFEKNWQAAWKEVLEMDGEQSGTDWLIGKKYAVTLVYRFGISSHLDENANEVVVKTKTKEWFVTSLRRLP